MKGLALPKSENGVMNLILKEYMSKKEHFKQMFSTELKNNEKFSLTLDEWTSVRGRRYFNINIHKADGNFYNLGLVRINGSCDAIKMRSIIENHFKEFGITFNKDIVACTLDGAAVNVKFGDESPTEIQLCLAHGIHLGVMDVLCSKDEEILSESESESDDVYELDFVEASQKRLKFRSCSKNCKIF